MRVLVVGAGVIGTVYGAHLSAAGHAISVLGRPPRACQLARDGMTAHDVLGGGRTSARVRVLRDTGHSRHAQAEMRGLAAHLVERIGNTPGTGNLRRLLSPGIPA